MNASAPDQAVSDVVLRTTAGAAPRFHVRGLRSTAVSVLGLVLGALLWEFVGHHTQQSSFVPFTDTIRALWNMIEDGELLPALWSSLQLFAAGLAIAFVIGFFGGLLL